MHKRTIVIGSGIGGLAIAIRRALAGEEVHVFEKSNSVGGKLYEFSLGGYHFDGGPSLFTQPQYVTELFDLAGKSSEAYFKYHRMDESCRYFWEDGSKVTAFADIEKFDQLCAQTFNESEGRVKSYLNKSQWKYQTVGHIFLEKSLHKRSTWTNRGLLKALFNMHRFDLFKSLHQTNQKHFNSEKLVQLFDRYATYNGSDPYQTSGMMSIIPHFEFNEGTFLPKGGMYAIPQALYKLGRSLGVKFHLGHTVDEIIIENNKVKGVRIASEKFTADRVVSNADVYTTYNKLLKNQYHNRNIDEERSTSAIVFYWGIKRQFDQLGLHNILFSSNYKSEFENLRRGTIAKDPTVYINISSKVLPQEAPEHGENWFVMINAPYDNGQDWDRLRSELRESVVGKINRVLKTQIEEDIEVEKYWQPNLIENQTLSYKGAIYGSASNSMMSAFRRHPNFHSKIKELYFCGGSVHPGGGIPLCLLSAKITSKLMGET